MATAQTKFYEAATTPVQVGRGTVATHLLTFAVDDTGTVGVAALGAIINNGNSSETWSITPPSGVAVSPSSGTLIASGTQALNITASTAGTYALTLVCAGATITGNPQSFVASDAAVNPTTATLSGSTSATEGVAVTYTVTLDEEADQTYTITPSASDSGAVSPSTRTITAGNTTGTFTVTWAAAGTGRTVDFTISPTLTRAGRPITVTVNAAAEPSLATGDPEFTLLSASSGTIPFTVGQAVRKGNMPSASGIAVVGATGQVTIKSTWDDSSAKFVIVAGTAALTADTPLTVTLESGTSSTGTALDTTDLPSGIRTTGIEIDAGAFGSATWTGTDFDSPFETWVSGHAMSSWTYRKQIGSDSHLVAWLEVRLYSSGAVEVLPWVENGYLLVTGPTSKSETYTFTMGGTDRFSDTIDLLHHQRTPLIDGTATAHWLGTAHDVIVTHDTDYLQATGLVPAYLAKTPTDAGSIVGYSGNDNVAIVATFTPLQKGNFKDGDAMTGGGYHNHVGLLPEWDAVYLTCPTATTYKGVVFNGYSQGRYSIHYRDEADDNRPVRLSEHPTLNITPPEDGWETTPATSGTAPPGWYFTHGPGMGYLPYLITGRRYFLDELQFVAGYNAMCTTSSSRRQGVKGIYDSTYSSVTERGHAWAMRSLAMAISATPDADTTALTEFRAQFNYNVDHYHDIYVGAGGPASPRINNGGFIESSGSVGTVGDSYWVTIWMQNFVVASWGWAKDLGLGLGTTPTTQLDELFEWKAASVVGLFGSDGDTEYCYTDYGVYRLPISPSGSTDWTTATGPWYIGSGDGWGDIYTKTWSGANPPDGSTNPYDPDGPKAEGEIRYWYHQNSGPIAAIPALAYAVKHGIAGAEQGWRRLTTAGNWYSIADDLDNYPLWAVAPNTLPKWRRGQAINEWREILNTASADTPATNTAYQRRYLGTVSTGATTTVIPMQAGGFDEYGTPADGQFSGLNVPLTIGGESRAITGYVASTNTFTVGIAFSSAPTNGTAAVVNGQASAGPARLDPYCGMTVDTRRSEIWQLGNGGHGDYYGNEVMKIDLMADEPEWREWMVGSSGYVINDNQFTAQYVAGNAWYDDDGVSGALPCSQHTYYCQQFIERHGRAVRFGGGSISSSGTAFVDVESFDADVAEGVNGWDAQYTYKAAILSGYTGTYAGGSTVIRPPVCRDPRTDHVYTMSAAGFREFTPSVGGPSGADTGGTWAGMVGGVANGAGTGDATAVDTTRGRMLMAGGTTLTYWVYDIDGGTGWTSGTFTGAAASAISGGVVYEGWGLVFVPEIDAYLMRDGAAGGTVLKIDAATFEVTDLGATDGGSIPATAARSGATEQVYNKFQYVPKLRGVVYAPANGENLWFLRTH